jgi:hypothetical protein
MEGDMLNLPVVTQQRFAGTCDTKDGIPPLCIYQETDLESAMLQFSHCYISSALEQALSALVRPSVPFVLVQPC